VNCPFCLEEVKAEALVCKTCHRDLMVPKPLMEANATLTARVAELEAEVASLRRQVPRETVAVVAAPPKVLAPIRAVLLYLLLPVLVLVAIHYLLVVRLDAKLLWLRVASIVLPALFGYVLEARHRPRWFVLVPMALVVAIASVLGMSLVIHLTDGDPIFPHTGVVWRETAEYVASIALAYLLGPLLSMALQPMKRRVGEAGLIDKAAKLVARFQGGDTSPKTIEQQAERLVKQMNLAISAATAAGAIYTGLKAVVQ
jgi:hypothetical protein